MAAMAWLVGWTQHMAAHRRATLLLKIYDTIYVTFFEDYPPKTTNHDQSPPTYRITLDGRRQNRARYSEASFIFLKEPTVSTHINLRRSIKILHFQGGGLFKFDQSGGLIKMEDFNY